MGNWIGGAVLPVRWKRVGCQTVPWHGLVPTNPECYQKHLAPHVHVLIKFPLFFLSTTATATYVPERVIFLEIINWRSQRSFGLGSSTPQFWSQMRLNIGETYRPFFSWLQDIQLSVCRLATSHRLRGTCPQVNDCCDGVEPISHAVMLMHA